LPAYGNRCVNSEYDAVKQLGIQPKPNPTRDRACAKAQRLLEEAIKSSSHENTKP
jgi:hypothetical protein